MGIESSTIYFAVCDKCDDSIGSPEWFNSADAREESIKFGWKIDDGHIFCPSCWKTRSTTPAKSLNSG